MAAMIKDSVLDVWVRFRTGSTSNTQECLYVAHNAAPTAADDGKLGEVWNRGDLPAKETNVVRFVFVSDTHSRHNEMGILPEGDIFVHGGDILMSSRMWSSGGRAEKYAEFNRWLGSSAVRCPTKLIVAGNHDRELEDVGTEAARAMLSNATYLENESFVWKGEAGLSVCVFGSPASAGHSQNRAFQGAAFAEAAVQAAAAAGRTVRPANDEGGAAEAPPALVLLTHGPSDKGNRNLLGAAARGAGGRLRAHLWGHLHRGHGARRAKLCGVSVCGSIMDAHYCPLNLPIVVDVQVG